jgi:hypothetical protein
MSHAATTSRDWDANEQLQRINALETLLRAERSKVRAEEEKVRAEQTLRMLAEERLEDLQMEMGIRDSLASLAPTNVGPAARTVGPGQSSES